MDFELAIVLVVFNLLFSGIISIAFFSHPPTHKWLVRLTLIPPLGLIGGGIILCVILFYFIRELIQTIWR